jgi:hypothetical protein
MAISYVAADSVTIPVTRYPHSFFLFSLADLATHFDSSEGAI